MKKIVRKFTKFNNTEFTAEHITIYDDGTVASTLQHRFEYEQQKIQDIRNKQAKWEKNVHELCNSQKPNILQFPPRA